MDTKALNATNGPVPQHITHKFDLDSVTFSSDFDSGNMGRVEKGAQDLYYVWTAPDCADTESEVTCRSWFYYHVKAPQGSTLTFVVKNLNLQGKLFREGMKPVFKSENEGVWTRVAGNVTYQAAGDGGTLFEVMFRHHFTEESVFFAFSYPWSYTENQEFLDLLEKTIGEDVYLHRENLINSLEGRKCELLTISSFDGIMETRESHPAPLFPEGIRPFKFQDSKKVVFVTGRVHPGETPGSHMVNGFLKWVCSADPRACEARRHFLFKVIPVLNPDGVFRGYYRCDTTGVNLNRFYQNPDVALAPTIWATRAVVSAEAARLYFYVDLHGHASKRGIFLYGNYMDFPKQVDALTFAKLMSLNCPNFDYEGSNFTERNMKAKDKRDGLSKEGSGRVALFRATNLTLCFTMEANYHSGPIVNSVPDSGLPEPAESVSSSSIYEAGPPAYTIEVLEDAGRALGVSLLDSIDRNPFSRVKNSEFANLQGVKIAAAEYVSTLVPFRFNTDIKKLVKNKDQLLSTLAGQPPPTKKKQDKSFEKPPEKRSERKPDPPVKAKPFRPPRPKTEKLEPPRETGKAKVELTVVNVKIKNYVMPRPVSPRTEARRALAQSPASGGGKPGHWKPGSKPRRATQSTHSRLDSNSRSSRSGSSHRFRDSRNRDLQISCNEQIIETPAE